MFVLVVQYCMSNCSSGFFQTAHCSVRDHKLLRGALFKGFGPWVLWDYCQFCIFITFYKLERNSVDGRNPAPPGMYKTL